MNRIKKLRSAMTTLATVLCSAALLLSATGTASAESKQRIDYSYSVDITGQFFSSTLTELNLHQDLDNTKVFSVRVLKTEPDGEGGMVETVYIREMETARYWQVYRLLRGVTNLKRKQVIREIGLCDSISHSVRLNDQTQTIYDVCGATANGPRVQAKMLRVVGLLDAMTNETVGSPQASFVRIIDR